jgi:hypothetical protein
MVTCTEFSVLVGIVHHLVFILYVVFDPNALVFVRIALASKQATASGCELKLVGVQLPGSSVEISVGIRARERIGNTLIATLRTRSKLVSAQDVVMLDMEERVSGFILVNIGDFFYYVLRCGVMSGDIVVIYYFTRRFNVSHLEISARRIS